MTTPDTTPDIDLAPGLEDAARIAAVREWNALHPAEQAVVNFDELIAGHRARLAAERRVTFGDYAEVTCGPHAGLVGRVRSILPAVAGEPERVRLTVQGGERVLVPMADVQKV